VLYKQAAGLVAKKGYTNIMTFQGGIPEWVKAGYALDTTKAMPKVEVASMSPGELKGVLGNVIILDIRTPSLYEMGAIKDSKKIPLDLLSGKLNEVPKGKKIVIVDHAGNQVLAAGRYLKNKGYEDVARLQGGLMAWVKEGFPLDK
jgi:rhodanese-related sulfurtransferase